ncbi:MAG: hypothetical protein LWW85_13530 [Marinilabiliales bacterium]|nr:hypothetical protein [Marinilabiliales bacterium]
MTLTETQKHGILYTILIHACLLLMLAALRMTMDVALQHPEGLLVDFGDSETGKGEEEPSAAFAPKEDFSKPPAQAEPTAAIQAKTPPPALKEEELMTQEHEPSIALHSQKVQKKKAEVRKPDPKAEAAQKLKNEKAAKQQQELLAMQKQKREAEIIGNINSRVKNAFGGGLTDNGSTSKGEGITDGPGNQGDPNGQPGVKKYGPGGGTGNGISFSLAGRQARSLPKPAYPGNEGGIVVVEVTVDKLGKVTAVRPGITGSTSSDPELMEAASRAARGARFNVDDHAPAFQKGTITYHFVLQ